MIEIGPFIILLGCSLYIYRPTLQFEGITNDKLRSSTGYYFLAKLKIFKLFAFNDLECSDNSRELYQYWSAKSTDEVHSNNLTVNHESCFDLQLKALSLIHCPLYTST